MTSLTEVSFGDLIGGINEHLIGFSSIGCRTFYILDLDAMWPDALIFTAEEAMLGTLMA